MRAAYERTNPVARIAASLAIALCLVLTIDIVSAGVALALELALFLTLGMPARTFWLRTSPVWIAAPFTALTIALYGRTSGTVHAEFLLARVSDGSLELAAATGLRVLAIGLPAVVLMISVDATALADGLAQVVRLPARFVLGALAAFRLVGLLADDWRYLKLARRARGVADRGRLARLFGQVLALLVLAIRRGSKVATAMEARAFGGASARTWARESRWHGRDTVLVVVGFLVGAIALTASIVTGSWNAILS